MKALWSMVGAAGVAFSALERRVGDKQARIILIFNLVWGGALPPPNPARVVSAEVRASGRRSLKLTGRDLREEWAVAFGTPTGRRTRLLCQTGFYNHRSRVQIWPCSPVFHSARTAKLRTPTLVAGLPLVLAAGSHGARKPNAHGRAE